MTYGVNGPSPLNELKYFDVPLIVKLVMCKEKHITTQEINEELQQLAIGQNDKKK